MANASVILRRSLLSTRLNMHQLSGSFVNFLLSRFNFTCQIRPLLPPCFSALSFWRYLAMNFSLLHSLPRTDSSQSRIPSTPTFSSRHSSSALAHRENFPAQSRARATSAHANEFPQSMLCRPASWRISTESFLLPQLLPP